MNTIRVKGVLRNIQDSHIINGIEFSKAHIIVPREDGTEDVLNIRFKKFSNPYKEDQTISLSGNVRSYSSKLSSGKNKVELYVFTYFDQPDLDENDKEYIKNSLIYHINNACFKLRELGLKTNCIKVILKTKDFKYFVEKKLIIEPTNWETDIIQISLELYEKMYSKHNLYRSSGIILENLIKTEDVQMSLFSNCEQINKKEALSQSIDKLTKKFKKNIVKIGYAQSPKNN